jgi:hypothetical protein
MLPANVPAARIRGLRFLRDGNLLIFGDGSLVARHVFGGATAIWRVPDPEITFHAALVEDSGATTLVGERPYRGGAPRSVPGKTAGVVTQFSGDRVTVIGDAINSTRLRGIARLGSGQLVACGDHGTIVRIELGVVEHCGTICGGHLHAIARMPDGGAVTVGAGGHALSLTARLEAKLEAVQTTKDLISLAVTDDGQAWAGSTQARLLRRSGQAAGQPSWIRMNKGGAPEQLSSSMIAVALPSQLGAGTAIRAIGDDGAVVEGRVT